MSNHKSQVSLHVLESADPTLLLLPNAMMCSIAPQQGHNHWVMLQVVQGMLLTRSGFEERVKATSNMQEMLKWLPSDLFRTCLARVSPSGGYTGSQHHLPTARRHLA